MTDLGLFDARQGLEALLHAGLAVAAHHTFDLHRLFHGIFLLVIFMVFSRRNDGLLCMVLPLVVVLRAADVEQVQAQGVRHDAEARKAHRRRTEHRVQLPAEQRDPYARSQRNTDDIVNEIIEKAKDSDGFIFGSPVYYAHPSGRLLSLMDRLFYAGGGAFAYKPAAAIVSARRAGTTASIDAITKHFTINKMPVISSNYWNMVHGNCPEEVMQDKEGLQIMRVLGQNMAWILKCIEAGKKAGIEKPETEDKIWTNFIR